MNCELRTISETRRTKASEKPAAQSSARRVPQVDHHVQQLVHLTIAEAQLRLVRLALPEIRAGLLADDVRRDADVRGSAHTWVLYRSPNGFTAEAMSP